MAKAKYSDVKVWTENKALLIQRYLYYFVLVTKHGAYIDGFAGPQRPEDASSWAAKLVLESEPRRLRHFFLYDLDPRQVRRLRDLKAQQPTHGRDGKRINRQILVRQGDFNDLVGPLLESGKIGSREATFCLLDQRTFECRWSTLEALARFKRPRIELFYFLPNHWLPRAMAAQRDQKILRDWWGRPDFDRLTQIGRFERWQLLCDRFRRELGYAHATALPIFQREDGGAIMYWMIHATDHQEAPALMARAYSVAVSVPLEEEQAQLGFL